MAYDFCKRVNNVVNLRQVILFSTFAVYKLERSIWRPRVIFHKVIFNFKSLGSATQIIPDLQYKRHDHGIYVHDLKLCLNMLFYYES